MGATFGMRLAVGLSVLGLMAACAGKSERSGDEDGKGGQGGDTSGGGKGGAGKGGGGTSGEGGSSITGGTSGTAGVGITVSAINQRKADKIDLLFMIDNSISMGDKQRILADAVPMLLQRLVTPRCLDATGNPTGDSSPCPAEATAEFPPIEDIHVGVITSSLGNHGGDVCVPDPNETTLRTLNDQAQLLPSTREGLYSWDNSGFLVWDPRDQRPVPDPHPGLSDHETNVNEFVADFANHVQATGERGCGYESSLEAWYRFLIDPEPVATVTNDGTFSVRGPVNTLVLQQRAAFLRPDSLLAIVMLTDENDCSITDENDQQGWLVGRRIQMPRASSECAHPGDPAVYQCCRPCIVEKEGCPASASDSECALGGTLSPSEDSTNLRCFRQKERFGVDWLYPVQRYTDGLTAQRIGLREPDASGQTEVVNPLFMPGADGTRARDHAEVVLVGIVGVPWQDLADDASRDGRDLTYLTAAELAAEGRWDVMLGDPDRGIPPQDPFMIDSVDERTGTNPLTGDSIAPATTTGAGNAINGHEQNIVNRDDLQYACTFDLAPDVPCTMANQDSCDCNAAEQGYNRSLCTYPSSGGDGVQILAKAYPGIRQLQVLQSLGDNAITASICPKNVVATGNPSSDPSYGYNPAVGAMVGRFREALGTRCLGASLVPDATGQIPCRVVEARFPDTNGCSCDAGGRRELPSADETADAVTRHLESGGYCGGSTGVSCSDYCLCELEQLSGSDLNVCLDQVDNAVSAPGFCYVDPDNGQGNPAFVSACPPAARRLLRFMGADVPAPGAVTLLACENQ